MTNDDPALKVDENIRKTAVPYLSLNYFVHYLFPTTKIRFARPHLDIDIEMEVGINHRFNDRMVQFYSDGIDMLVHRYDQYLNPIGAFLEE